MVTDRNNNVLYYSKYYSIKKGELIENFVYKTFMEYMYLTDICF